MDSWALVSVSRKDGLVEVGRWLAEQGIGILATSSTASYLRAQGLEVTSVEELTHVGEILDGRVKTLHPIIYAGILATDAPEHQRQREMVGAPNIVLVVVNLYPYETRWQSQASWDELVESIDIGGVSLIRAAAKNFARVLVAVDPEQYPRLMAKPLSEWTAEERRTWAQEAFFRTAAYDAMIAQTLSPQVSWLKWWAFGGEQNGTLRYGENPHQSAAFYRWPGGGGIADARQTQGKPLSYNNLADLDAAWRVVASASQPTVAVIKHQTPCAVATAATAQEAYQKAHAADPVSIFGGVVAVNQPIDRELAALLTQTFLEVVAAPGLDAEAEATLATKKNLRVLVMPGSDRAPSWEVRTVAGGFLVQDRDQPTIAPEYWQHMAGPERWRDALADLELAWRTVASVKSNAIVVVKDGVTVGIGGGQTNRVDAARHALERAGERASGAVLASDGFFPFGDVLELCHQHGVRIVVEPGGSIRDQESIDAANRYGITLLFTGMRHFRH